MKDVTLSMEVKLLEAGREYARRQMTVLNDPVCDPLSRTTVTDRQAQVEGMS
jgi:hypothetical protein